MGVGKMTLKMCGTTIFPLFGSNIPHRAQNTNVSQRGRYVIAVIKTLIKMLVSWVKKCKR